MRHPDIDAGVKADAAAHDRQLFVRHGKRWVRLVLVQIKLSLLYEQMKREQIKFAQWDVRKKRIHGRLEQILRLEEADTEAQWVVRKKRCFIISNLGSILRLVALQGRSMYAPA